MEFDIANGNLDKVQIGLKNQLNKNPADGAGKTFLHRASECNQLEIVMYLTEVNENPNPYDANRETPFNLAAKHGNKAICKHLAGLLLKSKNKLEQFLHECSKAGYLEGVEAITELVEDLNPTEAKTAFRLAVQNGHQHICKHLAGLLRDKNNLEQFLYERSRVGDLASFKAITDTELLEDPNPADANGVTPFSLAAKNKHYGVCRHLANIIKVKQPNNHDLDSMLHEFAKEGDLNWVKVFTDILSNPNPPDADGKTVFHWAALRGQLEIVKHIYGLVNGDIYLQDKWKYTPLHWAARNGELEVVKFISERIESTTLKTRYFGGTPLDLARCVNYHALTPRDIRKIKVVKYLEQKRLEEQLNSPNYIIIILWEILLAILSVILAVIGSVILVIIFKVILTEVVKYLEQERLEEQQNSPSSNMELFTILSNFLSENLPAILLKILSENLVAILWVNLSVILFSFAHLPRLPLEVQFWA